MNSKRILFSNKSKFFILAPANASTGGPECLHELAFHLKKIFNLKYVYMVYLPTHQKKPIHLFLISF